MAEAKRIGPVNPNSKGDQVLWQVGDHFVVTSALVTAFDTGSPETYVFPADKDGVITNWGELDGSFRGGVDHQKVIDGYVESLGE